MIAGIIAFFNAIPAIVELISRMGNLFDSLLKYAEQNNLNGWIDNVEKQIDALKNAKTQEDKLAAAQNLVSTIRGLGA